MVMDLAEKCLVVDLDTERTEELVMDLAEKCSVVDLDTERCTEEWVTAADGARNMADGARAMAEVGERNMAEVTAGDTDVGLDVLTTEKSSVSHYSIILHRIWGKVEFEIMVLSKILYIGENKGADQLRSNREADQRLCFRYTDSIVPLLSKSKICSL